MRLALFVFGLIATAGPLLFGAVDRLSQIVLLILLAIGVWAQPPAIIPMSAWGKRITLLFLGVVLFKEFAPATWFGVPLWRAQLTQDYSLEFPWTHNPEPGRAVDALIAGLAATVWFVWVRRLAADRENRPILGWTLFGAAAVVAIVSFVTRGIDPKAIYGLRYTPGWVGFGPFPNRNHSADFFAMGAIVGFGCITWAAVRKRWGLMVIGVFMLAGDVVAMLTTQSRGGLVAFGLGLCIFCALVIRKVRKRHAVALAVAAVFLVGGLAMTVGAPLLARFHSQHSGGVSNAMRVSIWKDAVSMWKDAPVFGHGLESFAQVFPFYQKVELENQVVLHPESSWLLWLTELGALPVLLALAGLALFLGRQLPIVFTRERSFYISAAGISATALILIHSFFDVPAHRWGTAGMALAALALACPTRFAGQRFAEPRLTALAPLAMAIFWALPLLCDSPKWSPLCLARVISQDVSAPASVTIPELESELRWFPLSPELHQGIAIRQAQSIGLAAPGEWQRHFGIAARLQPASWGLLQAQARACETVSPSLALRYWQLAVERGGIHQEDVLQTAVQETFATSPTAAGSWGRFVESNPRFLLAFAQLLPDAQARHYFDLWWKERAFSETLTPSEVAGYYQHGPQWGTRAQFEEWMTRRSGWRTRDYRDWAAMLHAWGDDKSAWQLLSEFIAEPDYPKTQLLMLRPQLETRWRTQTQNFVNARELAIARSRAGDVDLADQLIIEVAARPGAPPWFIQKAAHALAKNGKFSEAVEMLIGSHPQPGG